MQNAFPVGQEVYRYLPVKIRKSLVWLGLAAALAPVPLFAQTSVLTQHNNNARTGVNSAETVLTTANVNQTSFGKLFSYPVDGRIYAQPLYVPNVTIPGKGTHNVIYIATQHDSVYAFDADSNGGANATPLWQITTLDAAHGAGANATTVPNSDVSSADVVPEIGITSTPVIDATTGTIYVVSKQKEGPSASPVYVQRLHALDITTGAEKFAGPATIGASIPGTGNGSTSGTLTFDPKWEMNRPGLLLQNGVVYIAWGSHGDNGPWHGWVMSYNAATLAQLSAYCATPNGSGSGIWMAGAGLAADVIDPVNKPYGRLFIATGNGSFTATAPYNNTMSFGDDLVRLDLSGGTLTVQDSFTPSNQASLNSADLDVASGGVMLLPDQSTGGHTHLMVQAGKEGKLYVVDRDNMGGFNASTDNVVQEISGQTGGLWSVPAFWNNTLYAWGKQNQLRAFTLTNGLFSATPTATGGPSSGYPGASPSVSSSGNTNGIVWAIRTDNYNTSGPAILYAFNATNIATELYDSTQNASRDTAGIANKYAMPTVVNGKVYVGTANEVDVYGLLAGTPVTATPVISPAGQSFTGTLTVTMTDSTAGATIYYTTDGTTPTTASAVYTGAITVSSSETIRAIADASGAVLSGVASQTYSLQNQVATPSFSPATGNFFSPTQITISDATVGAKIYFTTDGSTPTTASALYSGAITVTASETIKAIAAATGMVNSAIASASYTYTAGTGSNFSNGFGAAGSVMTFNGSTALADTRLQLTNGGLNETSSAWYVNQVNVQSFTNDFTFQIANAGADGLTFAIQNNGLSALGYIGGGLGYGSATPGGPQGIPNSIAVKFDFYNNAGEGSNSTGLYTNGASPTIPAVDMSGAGINLASGDTFSVHMTYDGTTLTMTITDGVTNATFTTSWTINIAQTIGSNTAWVGFTGGSGGQSSSQKIETWTYTPGQPGPTLAATPAFSPAAGTYPSTQTVTISDATAGAAIFYTLDGTTPNTAAGGSTLAYTGPISVATSTTVKAIATASGFSPSSVGSAAYSIQTQASAPTFSPAAGTYATAQNVTLSSTTAGASIYYTLDGTTPNTTAGGSTVLYSVAIPVSATTTIKALATASGFATSTVSSATFTISSSSPTINFSSGFAGGGMIFNGSTALNGTRLRLTNGGTSQTASAWFNTPVSVSSFTNDFSFQVSPGTSPTADGFAFVMQANNTTAIGPAGGGLGYGSDTAGVLAANAILKSAAIKFDLYANSGETADCTGLYTNGASPTTPYVDLTGTPIDLHSGHIFNVHITYDGTTLTMTITDSVTAGTFTQSWPINLAATIGSSTAYFGFTGGTGGLTAIQEIITWTYSSGGTVSSVATPTFSPAAGTYTSAQSVTISDTTAGATIYYTTDGSTPTTASTKYTAAIAVASNTTINAMAAAAGFSNSAVGTATYAIQLPAATPTFSPAAGTYTSAQSVTIGDTTTGATIYYTTDGSTPTTASTKYTAAIAVASNTTVKAIAVAAGFSNSAVASAAYVIQLPAAATPTFSPAAGTYASAQTVTISDTTAGATIYYTTDGSTPTTASTKYTAAIAVSASQTVKAIATATGFANSAVGSAAYVIQSAAATPTFSPAAGTYASAQTVTISDTTAGATIYYTTDGSTPTTSSTKYTAAISVATTTTIKALAAATGFNNSAVASATYTIQPPAATPTFSPAAGTYSSAQTVTIGDTTAGATIYYTTDGSTPTTASTKYTAAITVSASQTVKAIATATGFSTSAIGSATYTISGATTVISFGSGFTTATGLQMNGGAALSGTRLRVTDGGASEGRSAFWATPVNVQAFTTDFTFQQAPGTTPTGDGMAFVLQNVAPTALGPAGGGLGYGPDTAGGTNAASITNSIAIKFDLYSNSGEGADSTGLYLNGASPTTPAVDMTGSAIDLHSGHVFAGHIAYDGTTLSLTITDTTTAGTFSTSWPVSIPTTIGSNTAYAGFTGGTGGATAVQDVITWTYSAASVKTPITYTTQNLTAVSSGPTFRQLVWNGFPDGKGTILDAGAVGDNVTFTVNIPAAGVYDIVYSTKKTTNRGTTQLAVNGTNVGPATDQYNPADLYGKFDLGTFNFATAGNYSFKFTVTGKNAASTSYQLSWDDFILTPQ
jgi:hypothetical protein